MIIASEAQFEQAFSKLCPLAQEAVAKTKTLAQTLAQALAQNASVTAPVNAPVNIAGLKTDEAIVLLLQHNPQLTRQQLAAVMGKYLRTIGRAIIKLQQTNQLKRIGSDKTGYWEVQP